jgi:hypothetical protein
MRNGLSLLRWYAAIACGLSLLGCASTQLNYNTQDLASTVDSLVTNQVLSNLSKFLDDKFAIPSQVAITAGTVTTNNSITPSLTTPLNVTAATTDTVARTFAAAISTATTNSSTRTLPNLGLGLSATDQWTQQWGIAPLTDPDQLRRLRVLYQFGANKIDERELLCAYPIIQNKAGATQPTGKVTYEYPTSDGKSVTVTMDASAKPKMPTEYRVSCRTDELVVSPDPAFLNDPSCVVCLPARRDKGKATNEEKEEKKVVYLQINRRLKSGWLKSSDTPFLPRGSISLGRHLNKYLYVESEGDLNHFYEFSLFVLEATTQNATSATGQSAGKGGPTKSPTFLLGPSIQLQ